PKITIQTGTIPDQFMVEDLLPFVHDHYTLEPLFHLLSSLDLFDSNFKTLKRKSIPILGKYVSSQLTIGALCIINKQVQFSNHVLIGESCKISNNTILDNCILENNVIIGSNCHLQNVIIESNTYIGNHMDIKNAFIKGNLIYYPYSQQALQVDDQSMLSPMDSFNLKNLFKGIKRVISSMHL
ncbi:hypothetical protein MJH12_11165, partial [bacterium]|nr:hypothetical protein [bacterium]